MKHRIYLLLMIVLPIFCGSLAVGELISYISQGKSEMSPVMLVLMVIAGFGEGIKNTWSLIIESEKNK